MKELKVLALIHKHLIPPEKFTKEEYDHFPEWKTEYDVITALKKLGHTVDLLGVDGELELIRKKIEDFSPHIVFNLLEEFDGNLTFDQHIVSYLELKKIPYTGCNPRGLTLARDKAVSKKILAYHGLKVPEFFVFPKKQSIKDDQEYTYPLIVKSLQAEGSLGISQASIVNNFDNLKERVEFIHETLDTDAIVERYIEGREFYVGVLGNINLKLLPVWELIMRDLPESNKKIATEKVKWSEKYRKKYKIRTKKAAALSDEEISKIQNAVRQSFQALELNGYARIDIRYTSEKEIYILEANPNPGIAKGEEFTDSAALEQMKYEDIISKILSLGISWHQSRKD